MADEIRPKRFRIAFSFAGEKRDFISRTARILADRFGESTILYDKFHEAEFANPDLAFDLPAFYKGEASLIVSVFCPDYEHKEWCGLEWRAIFSLIKEGAAKQIMLARFEHTDGKGLFGLGGFIVREQSIAARLRGHALIQTDDQSGAIAAYRHALELDRSLCAESFDVAAGLSAIAAVELNSHDYDAAERDYREALRIARVVDRGELIAGISGSLAGVALCREDWPRAEALAREALSLLEAVGRQELIAFNCKRLAESLLRQGKVAEAAPHASRAVAILTRLGSRSLPEASEILRECGRCEPETL